MWSHTAVPSFICASQRTLASPSHGTVGGRANRSAHGSPSRPSIFQTIANGFSVYFASFRFFLLHFRFECVQSASPLASSAPMPRRSSPTWKTILFRCDDGWICLCASNKRREQNRKENQVKWEDRICRWCGRLSVCWHETAARSPAFSEPNTPTVNWAFCSMAAGRRWDSDAVCLKCVILIRIEKCVPFCVLRWCGRCRHFFFFCSNNF